MNAVRRLGVPALIVIGIVVTAMVALTVSVVWERTHTARATLHFTDATGLFPGDPVKMRGVAIGTVESVAPAPSDVTVEVSYDDSVFVSASARAAIVSPTLVSGRYVQFVNPEPLDPEASRGAALADGAVVGLTRTAVPVGYDEIKKQVTDLAAQLGPTADDQKGTLSRFVDTSASVLGDNGQSLRHAVDALSDAASTLAAGGPDLFGTVRNLQKVVTALRASDDQIVSFSAQLNDASALLDDNRTQLDAAVGALNGMVPDLREYLSENRDALSSDVKELTRVSRLLVDREDDLAQILHTAPTALSNLYNIYDPDSNSLTAGLAIADFPDPVSLICALLTTVDAPKKECQKVNTTLTRVLTSELARASTQTGGR
ncbi:MCE family protein [Gordonia sp. PS3]|uniref:Mce family protein n=1 Tax=Gordonia sihwensis NBRC 108236 TaxID=1223544 RepID=L7LKU3_9ACTN|nr:MULTISPECIES: MCE family protein [Gordonia]AUH67639.1 MCE family protein [Gordonia sp. YC-JH1]MBY4568750.1 mammalian cell entry protein [Gordonia sihwensis]GAC61464.1 Mce family protein [Gordonia sihwensis NBRC 108236]